MNLKTKLAENLRNGIIASALSVLVGFGLWSFPIGQGLERLSYDLPSVASSRFVSDEVLIVQMDEVSSRDPELQPYSGPVSFRPWHARLLERLKADGAKMVVFDVFTKGPASEAADKDLIQALKNFHQVVLAADRSPVESSSIKAYSTIPPWSNFVAAASRWGIAAVDPDSDGVIRRHYSGNETEPSLPWAAAMLAAVPLPAQPSERLSERWLRYYGPYGTLPSLSYQQAFLQATGYFRGKIVFVGGKPLTAMALDERDEFPTPYTLWDGRYTSGAEILATTFLNLVHGDWLTHMPSGIEFSLVLLAGIIFGYGLNLVRPVVGAGLALGGVLAVAAFAYWLFWREGMWFSWVVIAAAQVPCAWTCALVGHTTRAYREKEKLAKENVELERELSSRSGSPGPPQPVFPEPDLKRLRSDTVIPDHELLRCIGSGAYGEVWLARNAIGTYHAVKIVHQCDFSTSESYAREFKGIQKYMPLSRQHPGLIQILHVGRNDEGGYYYCIMEAGDDEATGNRIDPASYSPRNLAKDLRKRGKLTVRECVGLILSLTDALDFLHRQRLLHRDIKPSNIIFVNGLPKLADIGLVSDFGDKDKQPSAVGTEGYMAPEQCWTAAADIYSLGKVIYEASMGRDRQQYPELPTSLAERADAAALVRLNAIILKACDEDVTRRYQSASELQADLEALQAKFWGGDSQ